MDPAGYIYMECHCYGKVHGTFPSFPELDKKIERFWQKAAKFRWTQKTVGNDLHDFVPMQ